MINRPGAEHINNQPVRPRVAALTAGGFLIVTSFHVALTLGAPLGAAALGGTHPGRLSDGIRAVTGLFAGWWLFAALVVLARGGYNLVPLPRAVSRSGTCVLVGLLDLGTPHEP
jgi:hypothetical protein